MFPVFNSYVAFSWLKGSLFFASLGYIVTGGAASSDNVTTVNLIKYLSSSELVTYASVFRVSKLVAPGSLSFFLVSRLTIYVYDTSILRTS